MGRSTRSMPLADKVRSVLRMSMNEDRQVAAMLDLLLEELDSIESTGRMTRQQAQDRGSWLARQLRDISIRLDVRASRRALRAASRALRGGSEPVRLIGFRRGDGGELERRRP